MADTKLLCPKCGSDQLTANKKGFSGKKAVAGALLTGGIGILAGTIGSNKIKITCLSCGHEFKPGQGAKSEADLPRRNTNSGCLVILPFFIFMLMKCGNTNNDKVNEKSTDYQKVYDSLSQIYSPTSVEKANPIENDFISQKTTQFKELINSGLSSEKMKNKADELTKSFLNDQQNYLKDWDGEIASIDAFHGKNSDIEITIQKEEISGQKNIITNGEENTFNCSISIVALQGDRKKYGYKGIKREGALYEKLKTLKEGDKIIFSAKIINATDNTEKTGLNLWTLLVIELTDIKKQ